MKLNFKRQEKNKKRFSVFSDGEYLFSVSEYTFANEGLYDGIEIEDMASREDFSFLTPVSEALPECEKIVLAERNAYRVRNGMKITVEGLSEGKMYRVFDEKNDFLALAQQNDGRFEIIKSFYGGA